MLIIYIYIDITICMYLLLLFMLFAWQYLIFTGFSFMLFLVTHWLMIIQLYNSLNVLTFIHFLHVHFPAPESSASHKIFPATNPRATAPGLPLRNSSTIHEKKHDIAQENAREGRNFPCPNGLPVFGMALLALRATLARELKPCFAPVATHPLVLWLTLVRLFLAKSKRTSPGP